MSLFEEWSFIDLTHPLSPEIPTWGGSCGFSLEIKKDYDRVFRVQQIKMHAGIGTHMDAPSHCVQKGCCIADLSLSSFFCPCCIVDVSGAAHADYEISQADIEKYELSYGKIPKGSLVIGWTGWAKYWKEPSKYRNLDEKGKMHFPAFSKEAAEVLLEREVSGVGIDTLSPDCSAEEFPVHHLFLGKGKYIIENVARANEMPCQGGYVVSLPLAVVEGTESPIRMVGLKPKRESKKRSPV